MPFPMKMARIPTRSAPKDEMVAKKPTKPVKSEGQITSKRSAEISPEGPNRKRSVLGDVTNSVTKSKATKPLKEDPKCARITRSKSGSLISSQDATQPAKDNGPNKKSAKKTQRPRDRVLTEDSQVVSSQDTFYESARESISSLETSLLNLSQAESSPDKEYPPVPENVVDFDKESCFDLFSVSEYAQDIFRHFRQRETKFIAKKYMDRQPQLTRNMRAVLVDWMAEVQESFELNHETLYLAVRLVDLYLAKQFVEKAMLQLLGTTALLIASKFDERIAPCVEDFLYICDDAYNKKQLLAMEILVLKAVDFDLGVPLSYTFLRRFAKCSKQTMPMLTLARYILELSLLEYDFIDVPDSFMAAAALSLGLRMHKEEPWSPTLEYYTGYKVEEFSDLVHRLNTMVATAEQRNYKTIITKYSHKIFFSVAKIPAVDNDFS